MLPLPQRKVARRSVWLHPVVSGLLLLTLIGLSYGSLPAQGRSPNLIGPASTIAAQVPLRSERPLSDLLNADGTLDLSTGYTGSLDPAGWRMEAGAGSAPRFVSSGSLDQGWDPRFTLPGVTGLVKAIALVSSTVYIGGQFDTAGGVAAMNIAAWDGSSWSALGSGIGNNISSDGVRTLAVSGGTLYVGGTFSSAGGVVTDNIAAWNGSSWSALGSGIPGEDVDALAVGGGTLRP